MLLLAQNPLTFSVNNNAITITSYIGPAVGVTNVVIPDTINGYPVVSIGDIAFRSCSNLTSVTIGNNVTNIGNTAFISCTRLPDFTVAADNPAYSSLSGVIFNKNRTTLIRFPGGRGGSYAVPYSVTSIAGYAFSGCRSLTNVTVPTSVTTIGSVADNNAFLGCTSLMSITFLGKAPVLVPFMDNSVFTGVPGTVYYYAGTTGWSATYGGRPTVMLPAPNVLMFTANNGAITITGYVGPSVGVTNVVIPETINGYPVTDINSFAFFSCPSLTNVVISDSVTNIEMSAFYRCYGLTNVAIGNSVTSIGDNAFYQCTNLTKVVIPASMTSIGVNTFGSCTSLTNIAFLGNAPALGATAFQSVSGTVYYYYGTSGWGTSYGGLPTVMLGAPAPQIGGGGSVAIQSGNFGFTISGASGQNIVVEASTNLVNWQPVWTNRLTSTSTNFIDTQWINFPACFYRAR